LTVYTYCKIIADSFCVGEGYLSGYLGSAFVPARLSNFEVVFVSSLPLVSVSTGAFMVLYILVGVLHLRGKGEEFNLSVSGISSA